MIYDLRQPAGSRRCVGIFCTYTVMKIHVIVMSTYTSNMYLSEREYLYTGSCRQDQSELLSMHSVFKVLNRRIYKVITCLFPILINMYIIVSLEFDDILLCIFISAMCLDSLQAILCKNYVEMDYENDRWVFTVAFCDNEKSFRRTPPGWRLFRVLSRRWPPSATDEWENVFNFNSSFGSLVKKKRLFLLPWIINNVRELTRIEENWMNYWNWKTF